MAVTQNETLFQILFTLSKDIPPKERDQMAFYQIWPQYQSGCALSHCCTTANSDIEMAPILMSVALQVGEQDANVDIKKYRSFKRGKVQFYFLYSSTIYL